MGPRVSRLDAQLWVRQLARAGQLGTTDWSRGSSGAICMGDGSTGNTGSGMCCFFSPPVPVACCARQSVHLQVTRGCGCSRFVREQESVELKAFLREDGPWQSVWVLVKVFVGAMTSFLVIPVRQCLLCECWLLLSRLQPHLERDVGMCACRLQSVCTTAPADGDSSHQPAGLCKARPSEREPLKW